LLLTSQNKIFTGVLRSGDPEDRVRRGHPHKVHDFKMVKGRRYVIHLVARFDTFLRLEDEKFRNLAMDDDGGGGLNSRIVFTAPRTEAYRIIVTNFARTGLG